MKGRVALVRAEDGRWARNGAFVIRSGGACDGRVAHGDGIGERRPRVRSVGSRYFGRLCAGRYRDRAAPRAN